MKTFRFIDDQYPDNGYYHTRYIVRAVLLNDKNEVALLKINSFDSFGYRNYYETPGGGRKLFESNIKALRREILEEVGVTIKDIKIIGKVIDFYNLLNRRNVQYYYLCRVNKYKESKLEEYEKTIIQSLEWVHISKVVDVFTNIYDNALSRLAVRREVPILKLAQDMLSKTDS